MKYRISYDNPLSHLIKISLTIEGINKPTIDLNLPIWRPGRYEAANYAKNIKSIIVHDLEGNNISFGKIAPSEWRVNTEGVSEIVVSYFYFAFRMDAGSSLLDEDQLYINFVNCMLYEPERMDEECSVDISIPDSYEIACGLKQKDNLLFAKNYHELADSPLIASNTLQHLEYRSADIDFHIWIQGDHDIDEEKLISDFKKFSDEQIIAMSSFPESDYHFLLHILPYKFYHGVEHGNSTVITLGPSEEVSTEALYSELLGVSSHELFHAWNILKIRPKELLPYDFNKAPLFPTGFVAEGFTTYYGDLFLARSAVFEKEWYFNELNKLFNRHFLNFGRLNHSVVESSYDLWLDGYQPSVPNKKSSIYVEGAMSSLLLDLTIRKNTNGTKSLDDVMRSLWQEYGMTGVGYTIEDIEGITSRVAGQDMTSFFQRFVYGTEPKEDYLAQMLNYVGCELLVEDSTNLVEQYFGIKVSSTESLKGKVILIAPDSVGEKHFSIQDEVLEINSQLLNDFDVTSNCDNYVFKIKRNHRFVELTLPANKNSYLKKYSIQEIRDANKEQKAAFNAWLNL